MARYTAAASGPDAPSEPCPLSILVSIFGIFALAAVAPWLSRLLGRAGGWVLALGPATVATVLASHLPAVARGEVVRQTLDWAPNLGLSVSVSLDGLGLLFALLISGVGALILVYAQGYLAGHRHLHRMHGFLLLFMGSMLGVVLTDNLLAMFVFWELTSISSYLLIGFDHNRPAARRAALQALLVTGGGGLALLVGILLLASAGGTYEVSELAARADQIAGHAMYGPIVVLFALGAFTKSAQFPFHFWLPGAMEAPTPVSAYLHSSTMVKAGIYLLARMDPTLGGSELWTTLLTAVGATTMVVGALLAVRQTYLKRMLAYSTVSSLGIIVMALGIGTTIAVEAGMAYLLAHALFKGSMFMVAGAIDHGTGERDAERLGGLWGSMRALAVVAVLAAFSMAGLPPLLGFVGKELLLKAVGKAPLWPVVLTVALTVAAALTVVVAGSVGVKPFFGRRLPTPEEPHAPGPALLLGPGLLAVLGLVAAVAPTLGAGSLVSGAAAATLGGPSEPDLSLWHGLTRELALSAAAVGAGIVLYLGRRRLRAGLGAFAVFDRAGPERMYEVGLRALNAVASGQTALLQNGYLRSYLFVTIGVATSLVGYTLWSRGGLDLTHIKLDVWGYEVAIGVLVIAASAATAVARTRLMAIAALGLAGYGVAVMFVVFGAPDLAMTQIAIDTLTVVLFVLVFRRLPDFRSISARAQKARDLLLATAAGALMTALVLVASLAHVGTPATSWFGDNAVPGGHGRNVVNVILVDFRAIDTMGEITVLAIAAVGVLALLKPSLVGRRRGGV